MTAPFIRMASGIDFCFASARPGDISLADIAHHLSHINRFNGATALPYSVAQHSCLVAQLLREDGQAPQRQLWGLLHDAHEAYLGDLVRPVKRHIFGLEELGADEWDGATRAMDRRIREAFGLQVTAETEREVLLADNRALSTEWRDLMPGRFPGAKPQPRPHRDSIVPQAAAVARQHFLNLACQLFAACHLPYPN